MNSGRLFGLGPGASPAYARWINGTSFRLSSRTNGNGLSAPMAQKKSACAPCRFLGQVEAVQRVFIDRMLALALENKKSQPGYVHLLHRRDLEIADHRKSVRAVALLLEHHSGTQLRGIKIGSRRGIIAGIKHLQIGLICRVARLRRPARIGIHLQRVIDAGARRRKK